MSLRDGTTRLIRGSLEILATSPYGKDCDTFLGTPLSSTDV